LGPSEVAGLFANAWGDVSGGKVEFDLRQRVYKLTRVVKQDRARGDLRVATERDLELVAQWMCGFEDEIFSDGDLERARKSAKNSIDRGTLFIWEDGKSVSMAAKARPLSRGVCVSLVFTPPEYRRRGYATACVAALSQRLLDEGWEFCSLFADLSNPASNRVYEKIGYEPVCDFDEYSFQPSPAP
jgi:predicted GNAT family acetyltransferase